MRLLLRPFLGLYNAPQWLDDRLSYVWTSTLSAHCVFQYWVAWAIWSFAYFASHWSFADEACKTAIVRLQVVGIRKAQKSFFALFAAISQVSTCHLCAWGALHGHPPSNGANQSSHRWGRKKWSGWNRTNRTCCDGPAVLPLFHSSVWNQKSHYILSVTYLTNTHINLITGVYS